MQYVLELSNTYFRMFLCAGGYERENLPIKLRQPHNNSRITIIHQKPDIK